MNPRLAYLISRYPAISHTFILREILELRKLGFTIETASINAADRTPEKLTEDERNEARRTFYVKGAGAGGALAANLQALLRSPGRYAGAFVYALRLAGADLKKLGLCFFYFIEAAMVGRWMESKSLTHLHVHFATPASTVGLIVTRMFPFTISLTVHGPDEFYDVPGYFLAEKISASRLLCTIGFYARSQLMRISSPADWPRMEITPLGVDPDLFSPRPFEEHFDVFEILCVGRLVPAKGQRVLVDAVAALLAQGRSVRLRIVGDGPDRNSLEAVVRAAGLERAVLFEGSVNQDRIRDFYRSAHLFALASFAEGIPVVLMEAMAMEIPCVTTWITGHPELIRNGVDGLLVAPSDQDGLAGAIARLMDDAPLRRQLGEAGRVRVIDKYHLSRNVARLAGVFRDHLADTAGGQS